MKNRIKYRRLNKANRIKLYINFYTKRAKRKINFWLNKEFNCLHGALLGVLFGLCFIGALFV